MVVPGPARGDDRTLAQHLRFCGRTATALGVATAIAAAPAVGVDAFVPVLVVIAAVAGTTEPYVGPQLRSAALMLAGAVYAATAAGVVQFGALAVGAATGWGWQGFIDGGGGSAVSAHPLVLVTLAAPFLAAAALLRADGALAPFPTVANSLMGVLLITGIGAGGDSQPHVAAAVSFVATASGRLVVEGLLAAAIVSAAAFLGGGDRGLYAGSQLLAEQLAVIGAGISAAASVLLEGGEEDDQDGGDGWRNGSGAPLPPQPLPAELSTPPTALPSFPFTPPSSVGDPAVAAAAAAAVVTSKPPTLGGTSAGASFQTTATGTSPSFPQAHADTSSPTVLSKPPSSGFLSAVRLPRLGSSACLVQLGTAATTPSDDDVVFEGNSVGSAHPRRLPRLGSSVSLSCMAMAGPSVDGSSPRGAGGPPAASGDASPRPPPRATAGGGLSRVPLPRLGSSASLLQLGAAAGGGDGGATAGADAGSSAKGWSGGISRVRLPRLGSSVSLVQLATTAAGAPTMSDSGSGGGAAGGAAGAPGSPRPPRRLGHSSSSLRLTRMCSSTSLGSTSGTVSPGARPALPPVSRDSPSGGRRSRASGDTGGGSSAATAISVPGVHSGSDGDSEGGGGGGGGDGGDEDGSPRDSSSPRDNLGALARRSSSRHDRGRVSPSPRAAVRRQVRSDYARRAAAVATESVLRRVESVGSVGSAGSLGGSLVGAPPTLRLASSLAGHSTNVQLGEAAPLLGGNRSPSPRPAVVAESGTSNRVIPGDGYGSTVAGGEWPRTLVAWRAHEMAADGRIHGGGDGSAFAGGAAPPQAEPYSIGSESPAGVADTYGVTPPQGLCMSADAIAASPSETSDEETSCSSGVSCSGGDHHRSSRHTSNRNSVQGLNDEVQLSSGDVAACLSALARSQELLAAGALEPKLGSPHLFAPEPTADLASLVRAAEGLLARTAALDTVAHGGAFDGPTPPTARFFTDAGAAPEWQSLFASSAAGCVVLGRWLAGSNHRRDNLAHLELPAELDARAWGRRRSILYRAVLRKHQRYWCATGGGGNADDAASGGAVGDTTVGGGVAEVLRAAEMRAVLYAAVASHSVAHALGTVVAAAVRVASAKAGPATLAGLWRAAVYPATATRATVRRWATGGLSWSGQGAFAAQNFALLYTLLVAAVLAAPSGTGGPPSETAWVYCSAALAAQASVEATVFIGGLRVVASAVGSATAYLFHIAATPLWGASGQHAAHDAVLVAYMAAFAGTTLAVAPARFRHAAFLTIVSNIIVALGPRATPACIAARAVAASGSGEGAGVMRACAPSASYAVSRAVHVALGALAAMASHTLLLPRFAGVDARLSLADAAAGAVGMYAKLYQSYLNFSDPADTNSGRGSGVGGGSPRSHGPGVSLDSLASLNVRSYGVLTMDMEAHEMYEWNTLTAEVQTAVEGHLLRATRMLNAETGGWQGGPFARPMAHNAALVPHFQALMHAVSELAVVLERRPVLTGAYTRSAHRLFIEPLARPRAAVLTAAVALGETVVSALRLDAAFGVAAAVTWIRTHVLTSSASVAATIEELDRRLRSLRTARGVWRVGYTAALSAVHEEHARRAPRVAAATARAVAVAEAAAVAAGRLSGGDLSSASASPATGPVEGVGGKGGIADLSSPVLGPRSHVPLDGLTARAPVPTRPHGRRLVELVTEEAGGRPLNAGLPCSRLSVDGRLGFREPSQLAVPGGRGGAGGHNAALRRAETVGSCLTAWGIGRTPPGGGRESAPYRTSDLSAPSASDVVGGAGASSDSLNDVGACAPFRQGGTAGGVGNDGVGGGTAGGSVGGGGNGIRRSWSGWSTDSGGDLSADADSVGDPVFLNSDDAVLFHAVTYTSSAVLDALVHLAETLLAELREREQLAAAKASVSKG
ncbi:hypothetical protein MMPV_007145 [Pyropia vietnamensis]